MSHPGQPLYLDNASTTQVDPTVAALAYKTMTEHYGNPSSLHQAGVAADNLISNAKKRLSSALGDSHSECGNILWTSGGTEADAIGLLAVARSKKHKKSIAISSLEHSAIRSCANTLFKEGHELIKVDATKEGIVTPEEISSKITPDTQVLSLIVVQNEIGTVLPIQALVKAARAKNPNIHVHCDGVQALGKVPISVMDWDIDSLALSAHKIHGPKGVGALWIKKNVVLNPLWSGGGQQDGLRSGTQNVPGIAAFGLAAELAQKAMPKLKSKSQFFKTSFVDGFLKRNIRFKINGSEGHLAGHVLSFAFENCPAGPLLHTLESRGIYCSAGSACSEKAKDRSPILTAIGTPEHAGTIRFSIGRLTSDEDLLRGVEIASDVVSEFQS